MNPVIKINHLCVSYSGIEAIHNINLQINSGEFVSVIGPNGGGKTTLLNTVLGFLKPVSGDIELNCPKTEISFVPQISTVDRGFPITVEETVLTAFLKGGLHPFKRFSNAEKQKATEFLRLLGIERYSKSPVNSLSGGEFQRLLIARALASNPKILLLDEPTANVDTASAKIVFSTLKKLNRDGLTVIVVTHDINSACTLSDRLVAINRNVIYNGTPLSTEDANRLI